MQKMLIGVLGGLILTGGIIPAEAVIRAMMIDGQNNHDWKKTTPAMKKILESCGLFQVDVLTSPPEGASMESFSPQFSDYQVVVTNYNGESWPEKTRQDFADYIRNGGGLVVVHAADNPFPEWAEYNEMIGLGGWGGRDEKSGPYVRWRDGKVVFDNSPGPGGSHGPQHEIQVEIRSATHPVTAGLPSKWLHATDEIYNRLRGPAKNMTVLATALTPPDKGGTGEHEPMLLAVDYGKGRVFHTVLGHEVKGMECVGFIFTLQRGAEWAATGKVTLKEVPEDFPGEDLVRTRPLE